MGELMRPGEKLQKDTDTVEETGTVPKLDPRAEDPGPPPPRKPQSGGLSKFDSGTGAQKDLYIGMFRVDQSVRCADAPLFNIAPLDNRQRPAH